MLDVFNIAKPQNCDIQIFYGSANAAPGTESRNWRTWNKPRGVSHIYMLLIGGGGNGNGVDTGGGSGAISVWYGAAQHVPDTLSIYARGTDPFGYDTTVGYRSTTSAFITLLKANSAASTSGGSASGSASAFTASGFFNVTAGQDGATSAQTASPTTFLGGGTGSLSQTSTANYGYNANVSGSSGIGYFQLQPIIVGVGSAGNNYAAVGCGSGINGTVGGPGMVLIASW